LPEKCCITSTTTWGDDHTCIARTPPQSASHRDGFALALSGQKFFVESLLCRRTPGEHAPLACRSSECLSRCHSRCASEGSLQTHRYATAAAYLPATRTRIPCWFMDRLERHLSSPTCYHSMSGRGPTHPGSSHRGGKFRGALFFQHLPALRSSVD